MIIVLRQNESWTVKEYLAFMRESEYKYDYIDGQIYMMAGGRPAHNQISANVGITLGGQLQQNPCIIYSSDQAVRAAKDRYFYPDLTIICGDPQFDPLDENVLINPTLLVEVLSPSTESYDRGEKAAVYRQIPSLQHYIFVTPYAAHIEVYARQANGKWEVSDVDGLDAAFAPPAIGDTLTLADVYNKVTFDPADLPRPVKPLPRTAVESIPPIKAD
ncbi:MAG: Uma2 family endonuclease [Chloroflexota bacterium]|nr:Uma2 family endonuclease [Chloroflexota bacterium]